MAAACKSEFSDDMMLKQAQVSPVDNSEWTRTCISEQNGKAAEYKYHENLDRHSWSGRVEFVSRTCRTLDMLAID